MRLGLRMEKGRGIGMGIMLMFDDVHQDEDDDGHCLQYS